MAHWNSVLVLASGPVVLSPDPGGLPGSSALQKLANGVGWWGLLASLLGLIVGAATWALGSHTNNYQHASAGRRAVLVSGAAALLIGAAPQLLNFFWHTGQSIR